MIILAHRGYWKETSERNSDDALKKMEDIILKGDYEKLFTKENTRNYVIANKVKPKPLFCKKRGFVLLKK